MNDFKALVSDYLQEAETMQLATVGESGQPWICTVYFAADEHGAMYWTSLRNRRHSEQVRAHAKVAVAVVKEPLVKRALQMEGKAYELSGDAAREADRVYSARHGHSPKRLEYALSGVEDDPAYYVFRPTKVVLFDEINFPDEPRKEVR
jgi:uncharacterized protein YhbP (UPF0306 family)